MTPKQDHGGEGDPTVSPETRKQYEQSLTYWRGMALGLSPQVPHLKKQLEETNAKWSEAWEAAEKRAQEAEARAEAAERERYQWKTRAEMLWADTTKDFVRGEWRARRVESEVEAETVALIVDWLRQPALAMAYYHPEAQRRDLEIADYLERGHLLEEAKKRNGKDGADE